MALGDGSSWDETVPSDATTAIQIDDYNRDLRVGVSARMRFEHEWPDSQSATSEGGKHKFITFQDQGTKPTIAGTQTTAIYEKTNNLWFENSGGTEIQIVAGTAVGDGKVLITATDTAANYLLQKCDTTSIGLINTTAGAQLLGAIALPATKVYDSGWFAATAGNDYTVTHGLGSTALVPSIWYAQSTTGASVVAGNPGGEINSAEIGAQLGDYTITECTLFVTGGPNNLYWGKGTKYTSGAARIILVAID